MRLFMRKSLFINYRLIMLMNFHYICTIPFLTPDLNPKVGSYYSNKLFCTSYVNFKGRLLFRKTLS